ncbi:MAG: 3-hydroxyacyl-CoA dehydrogenase NAD-binding domain-containing protein [Pikeienuella sp.]
MTTPTDNETHDNPAVAVVYEGEVAIVSISNPPVNAISHAVREGLCNAVEEIEASSAHAAVLICIGRTFIAGADIREFSHAPKDPSLHQTINAIENSTKPWVAALHGTALGGGLEVALGCHYRVAKTAAKMGLPEVHLGVIPGAGGTQRLPRVIGAAETVRMATTGTPISAEKALELGLVHQVTDGNLLDAAKGMARAVAGTLPPIVSRTPAAPAPSNEEWAAMETAVARAAKGQRSPLAVLESIRNAYEMDLATGLDAEREIFMREKNHDQSAALRHAFFAERAAAKPDVIKGVTPKPVELVAVIGGGLMGSGIATSLLFAGLKVVMIEMNDEAAAAGRDRVEANMRSAIKRGKISEPVGRGMMANFAFASNYGAAQQCDIAIEAVFEDLDVKRGVFAQLAEVMRDDAIIATNTSYLDPNAIAEGIAGPDRVVGMHFFSPAHIMKLCEVVQTVNTSPTTLATAFWLTKTMRKVGALSGVCEGFIGNRILASYRRVCEYMMEDMRDILPIDQAMRQFGLPMGPFELVDLAGLQIGWATRKRLAPTRDPNQRYSTVADTLCEAGRFGQKTQAGWYRYAEGDRKPKPDPFVVDVIAKAAADRPKRHFSAEEIQRRALAVMVNEGAKILEEGIAARPLDIDVVKLFGYGFPRWRGGPMMQADLIGVDQVLSDMERVATDDPGSWEVSQALRDAAAAGGFARLNG